ncbi:MAG: LexA family protein [Candidatus Saccharimonadales bacterium]
MPQTLRPTKKQYELLKFVDNFIAEHGYSPSYREIMAALGYNSVATVALHVNSLIARGHLSRRGSSARSLEVTGGNLPEFPAAKASSGKQNEDWLLQKVEALFAAAEKSAAISAPQIDKLQTIVASLKILNLEKAFQAFNARLGKLKGEV